MVGPSKILTVSYGTFSCTLEGFDEPFNTMKAIAEYFRDLAADDRYFGAEPPTPDAEMLHRIAEREIQRRVEAKINEHGVILRQTEAAPEPSAEPAPVLVAPAPAMPAPVAVAPVVVAAPVVVSEPAEIAAPPVAADPLITETVDAAPEAPEMGVAAAEAEEAEEAAPVDAFIAEPDEVAEAPEMEAPEAEEISLDAIMAAAQDDLAPAPQPVAEAPVDAAPDSLAAKLQRIRAVVETVRAGQPVATFDEDEPTDLQPATGEGFDSDFGFELDLSEDAPELLAAEAARAEAREMAETSLDEEEAAAPLTLEASAEEDVSFLDEEEDTSYVEEDVSFVDGEEEVSFNEEEADEAAEDEPYAEAPESERTDSEAGDMPHAAVAQADAYEEEAEAVASTDEDDALLARLSDLAQSTAVAASEPPAVAETVAPPAPVARAVVAEEDDLDEDYEPAEPAAEAAHDDAHPSLYERARARVIRIGKAATRLGGKSDDHAADDHVAEGPLADEPEAALPEEEEFHAEHPAFAEAPQEEEGGDVERLMEEARVKLEGAENRRRFSAIAHLKAAVAATLADRKMQPEAPVEATQTEAPTDMSLYRDDLSKAVRPRRPAAEAGAGATRRPSLDARPAPLVLVSEQRVDRQDLPGHDGAAIRPRRVSASAPVTGADDRFEDEDFDAMTPENASNFAEFAESLGAHSLTDLLEAAAVYTSSVEGQEHFTRPQLLRKVEFVSSRGDYNREDGLRSFGMLLRQGKIQKVAPGQFAVADASKYATEARRAAN